MYRQKNMENHLTMGTILKGIFCNGIILCVKKYCCIVVLEILNKKKN